MQFRITFIALIVFMLSLLATGRASTNDIVFTCDKSIYSVSSDGTNLQRLTTSSSDYNPRWTPDGRRILFSRSGQIWLMNADGTDARKIIAEPSALSLEWPTMSPDGRKILYVASDWWDTFDLYAASTDGSLPVRLNHDYGRFFGPDWSPDGMRIAVSRDGGIGTHGQIFTYDQNGADPLPITIGDNGWNHSPRWSPDGKKLLFARYLSGSDIDIMMMDPDGSDVKTIAGTTAIESAPAWSSDGRRIAFVRDFNITIMNADGSKAQPITTRGGCDAPDWRKTSNTLNKGMFDFDGDGKADQAVFRPAEGVWYLLQSRDSALGYGFGLAGDQLTAADYDGDGKTDPAIYREGVWWVLNSNGTGHNAIQWGIASDIPVAADYDGDGKADRSVYRDGTWWILFSSGAGYTTINWGIAGDKPVPADYDGDGKADFAVYRKGEWWILFANGSGYNMVQSGQAGDIPVPADYDGDGRADIAFYRQGEWSILNTMGQNSTTQWGEPGDIPVPADYNGDGRTDISIYRTGEWWTLLPTGYTNNTWGIPNDIPVPMRY